MSGKAEYCYECRGGWKTKARQRRQSVKKEREAMFERVVEPMWLELELLRMHGSAWLVRGGGAGKVWIGMPPTQEKCEVQVRWEAFNRSRVVGARPKCRSMGWVPWLYDSEKMCMWGCDPCKLAKHINKLREETRRGLRGGHIIVEEE